MKRKLYSEIRFVQSYDDDYNRIDAVFCGIDPLYCEGNAQPIIDYLSAWDSDKIS